MPGTADLHRRGTTRAGQPRHPRQTSGIRRTPAVVPVLTQPTSRQKADALPFADSSFDTVVCTVPLCNIPDGRAAIGEMYRVLRSGGRAVLLDYVASDRRWVLTVERLLEPRALRLSGDYLTRRPPLLVEAAGFAVAFSQWSKAGVMERLIAVKPQEVASPAG